MSYVSTYDGVVHLTCAETAKLMRQTLKAKFPGTKFSVRSDSYSGGASINVRWTDGPTEDAVKDVVRVYEGAGFDGMIDLKYHKNHWMEPDGTVHIAHNQGTEGSRGCVPEMIGDPMTPGAQLVSFGSDYVLCSREISPEIKAAVIAEVEAFLGGPFEMNDDIGVSAFVDRDSGGMSLALGGSLPRTWGSSVVAMLAGGRDYTKPCVCPGDGRYPCGGGNYRCAMCGKEVE